MAKQSLTDAGIRAMKPPVSGQTTVWDANSPLGLRVSSKGAKTYIVLLGSGKRCTIGSAGLVTLSEARSEAKRLKAEKVLGITKPTTITFAVALTQFLAEHYAKARPATKKEATRLLNKHFLPGLGRSALNGITDRDVERELKKITAPSEQLHAFRTLRAFLNWCKRPPRRYIQHSPMEGYAPPGKDGKGTRIFTDDEMKVIWREAPPVVRLLVLWGSRRGETGLLMGEWFRTDRVLIPSTTAKNDVSHTIPLLPLALEVLGTVPKTGLVYGVDTNDWNTIKRRLIKATAIKDFSFHHLRRTWRSTCARLRVPKEIASLLMNHRSDRDELDEIYDHYDYFEEKVSALSKIEAHISQLTQAR